MLNLKKFIINYFLEQQNEYDIFIPYEEGQAHSIVLSKTNVITKENHTDGIFYRIKIPDFIFEPLGLQKFLLKVV